MGSDDVKRLNAPIAVRRNLARDFQDSTVVVYAYIWLYKLCLRFRKCSDAGSTSPCSSSTPPPSGSWCRECYLLGRTDRSCYIIYTWPGAPPIAHKSHQELSEQRPGAPLVLRGCRYVALEGLALGLGSNGTGWQWNIEHQFSPARY